MASVFRFSFALWLASSCCILTSGLKCRTCHNAVSNEDCKTNGELIDCKANELSCQTEVRISNGAMLISKKCHQYLACENNALQNSRPAWMPTQCNEGKKNSVCRCCCNTDDCNVGICGKEPIPTPVTSTPVTSTPVTSTPITTNPVTTTPVTTTPVTTTPVTTTPVTTTPVTTTSVTPPPVTLPPTTKAEVIPTDPIDSRTGIECFFMLPAYVIKTCSLENNINIDKTDEPVVKPGSKCVFSCPGEMVLMKNDIAMNKIEHSADCKDDGMWTDDELYLLNCKCSDEVLINGKQTCIDQNFYGDGSYKCSYQCDKSYKFYTSNLPILERVCQGRDGWPSPIPQCHIKCDPIGTRENGDITCTDGICNLVCRSPYVPRKPALTQSKCVFVERTNKHKWDKPLTRCMSQCTQNKPPNKYMQRICSEKNWQDSVCSYQCSEGFELKGKEKNEKVCVDKPGQNARWLPQEMSTEPCCIRKCPSNALVDIVFVLDSSSSIGAQNFKVTKDFVQTCIREFRISVTGTRVAVIRYNDRVYIINMVTYDSYNDNQEELLKQVEKIDYDGKSSTNTGEALTFVVEHLTEPGNINGRRRNVPLCVVVITDGMSQDRITRAAAILNRRSSCVIAISVQQGPNQNITTERYDQLLTLVGNKVDNIITTGYNSMTIEEVKVAMAKKLAALICKGPQDQCEV